MTTKICSKCKRELDTSLFNLDRSRKNGLQTKCRECSNLYTKKHYDNNKSSYRSNSVIRKAKIKDWFKEYKTTIKCSQCSENHPACLHFHHPNNDKEFNIGQAVLSGFSIDNILKEIKKCQVLCANCHSKLHYEEKISRC